MGRLAMISYGHEHGIKATLAELSALVGKSIEWVDDQDDTVTIDGEPFEYGSLDVLIEHLGLTIRDTYELDSVTILALEVPTCTVEFTASELKTLAYALSEVYSQVRGYRTDIKVVANDEYAEASGLTYLAHEAIRALANEVITLCNNNEVYDHGPLPHLEYLPQVTGCP